MLRTLLQPRYAALSVLMVIVAAICTAAGVWQVARLGEKISANDALRDNATPRPPWRPSCRCRRQAAPSSNAVEYRTVTATGSYLAADQVLVRQRSVNSDTGYLVLTPLRTDRGRPARRPGLRPASAGRDTLADRRRRPDRIGRHHRPGPAGREPQRPVRRADNGQVESINSGSAGDPARAAGLRRLRRAAAGQPGTSGLVAIPAPDLSNPAGGAIEPQHLAYVIQWFLFAVLALAAPFAMARAEARRAAEGRLGELPRPDGERQPTEADRRKRAVARPAAPTDTDGPAGTWPVSAS